MFNTALLTVPNIVIIGAYTILALIVLGFISKAAGVSIGGADGAE